MSVLYAVYVIGGDMEQWVAGGLTARRANELARSLYDEGVDTLVMEEL